MKKMIPVMMLSGIIGLSACGNKTEQPQQNADTLEVADTIKEDTAAIDTPQTAEVQENAQEEKTDWIMSTLLPRTLNPISTSNSNTSSRLRRSRILRSTNLATS